MHPIRRAVEADIPRLIEIRAAVRENILSNPDLVTESDYRWFIAEGLLWVWDEDGIIKGLTAGDTRDGWIWALFVDPTYEGNGIGKALFPYACRDLKNAGHVTASLSTESGSRAEKFYQAAGWRKAGLKGESEIVFEKDL